MKIVRRHSLGKEAAKARLESELPSLLQQFGGSVSDLTYVWQSYVLEYSFKARGFGVNGTLEITDTKVKLDLRLPFMARAFEGTIRSNIEPELDRIMDEHEGENN
ncbi:MAG: polyhydroxyalkanoic acid system family protein [SAR202 cluster bacterium]|nr:polyhydroxyalkanoic acid system family protein [SAR202 cluster bacterium]